MQLDPLGGVDPSLLRFEALVGHFSTYSVVAVASAHSADFDLDGDVDGADLIRWQLDFGVNGDSDADADGDSDGADFLAWQQQFGRGPAVAPGGRRRPRAGALRAADSCGGRLVSAA